MAQPWLCTFGLRLCELTRLFANKTDKYLSLSKEKSVAHKTLFWWLDYWQQFADIVFCAVDFLFSITPVHFLFCICLFCVLRIILYTRSLSVCQVDVMTTRCTLVGGILLFLPFLSKYIYIYMRCSNEVPSPHFKLTCWVGSACEIIPSPKFDLFENIGKQLTWWLQTIVETHMSYSH